MGSIDWMTRLTGHWMIVQGLVEYQMGAVIRLGEDVRGRGRDWETLIEHGVKGMAKEGRRIHTGVALLLLLIWRWKVGMTDGFIILLGGATPLHFRHSGNDDVAMSSTEQP